MEREGQGQRRWREEESSGLGHVRDACEQLDRKALADGLQFTVDVANMETILGQYKRKLDASVSVGKSVICSSG